MKIVVAADSFKGSMRSDEAGSIIAEALGESLEDAEIKVIPVADGGEGTTDAVVRATGGEIKEVTVTGPLGEPVTAHYGLLPDGETAVMEMVSASGLELVSVDRLDPMKATTYGTGELMRAAIETGVRKIILGIGGSATVDGGAGMAQALGFRLLSADGSECGRGGEALATIAAIETDGVMQALADCRIRVACDVTNPLLGERGAARVFGPQKGATPAMVELLEEGLGLDERRAFDGCNQPRGWRRRRPGCWAPRILWRRDGVRCGSGSGHHRLRCRDSRRPDIGYRRGADG